MASTPCLTVVVWGGCATMSHLLIPALAPRADRACHTCSKNPIWNLHCLFASMVCACWSGRWNTRPSSKSTHDTFIEQNIKYKFTVIGWKHLNYIIEGQCQRHTFSESLSHCNPFIQGRILLDAELLFLASNPACVLAVLVASSSFPKQPMSSSSLPGPLHFPPPPNDPVKAWLGSAQPPSSSLDESVRWEPTKLTCHLRQAV